jgi:hypothetical protein
MDRVKVSKEHLQLVAELRESGYTRREIAQKIGVTFNHIRHLIDCLPKPNEEQRKWYRKERLTCTDAMPNPFPKWWCDKHNLDRNFYRPKWKDQ